jgi:hypothetical protein
MLQHAELGEFIKFFQERQTHDGKSWAVRYFDTKLGNMQGLTETFCYEVLWPKIKDSYIESVVKGLENKLESTYKITIEQL